MYGLQVDYHSLARVRRDDRNRQDPSHDKLPASVTIELALAARDYLWSRSHAPMNEISAWLKVSNARLAHALRRHPSIVCIDPVVGRNDHTSQLVSLNPAFYPPLHERRKMKGPA